MKLSSLLFSAFFLSPISLFAEVLPGDIAFILFDSENGGAGSEGQDQFAVVALSAIAADDQIYFRDDEWTGSAFAGTNAGALSEDELLWTAPTEGVTAGTVIVFSSAVTGQDESGEDILVPSVSLGTVDQTIGDATGLAIGGNGDEIWAFVGESNTPTTFLAAISSEGFDGTVNTLDGTGLVAETAFAIELQDNIDHAFYSGPREGLPSILDYPIFLEEVNKTWTQESPTGVDLVADITPFVIGGTPVVYTTLSFSPESFLENAGAAASTGTVSLSVARDVDTIIDLASDDLSEAIVPATVTIAANSLSATFAIDAVDDGLPDGDRPVQISACATDIVGDESPLTVIDDGDAPTTLLATGDILFTCFNTDNNSFGFVAISDIPSGETIYFTDEEWDGSAFGEGESDIVWTAPEAGLSAGEVIIFSDIGVAETTLTGGGTFTKNGSSGLSTTADTIYAYQGLAARQPVTFLAAIGNSAAASIENTGLTAGVDAFYLDNTADDGQYTASRSGQASIADYAPLIADLANNWTIIVGGDNAANLCNDTDFVTGPIVQPTSIEIVACGFSGDAFFIEIANPTTGFKVTSSTALDFGSAEDVTTIVNTESPNRFLIPASERNSLRDFFRVEPAE